MKFNIENIVENKRKIHEHVDHIHQESCLKLKMLGTLTTNRSHIQSYVHFQTWNDILEFPVLIQLL